MANGQYGPEALINSAGVLVGANVTASGYVCTVDAKGNLTVTGPSADAVTFTVRPLVGSAFTITLPVPPLPSTVGLATADGLVPISATAASATFATVVEHGATAATARPTGAVGVFWRGTVTPTNIAVGDRYINNSTPTAPTESICTGVGPVVLASLGGAGAVTSVATRTGAVVLSSADLTDGTAAYGFSQGFLAARPAATTLGWYFATDDGGGTLYRSTGAAWQQQTSRGELGYAQITSTVNVAASTPTDVSGLTTTVTVGTRPISVEIFGVVSAATAGDAVALQIAIDGTYGGVGFSTTSISTAAGFGTLIMQARLTPAAGSHTYKVGLSNITAARQVSLLGNAQYPAFIRVREL
jgi:hypothetical protein